MFLISKVDAAKDPVFTTPFLVIATPFGLISNTLPFEFIWPAIVDGVEPVTLFREEDLEEGILKSTLPPL